MKSLEQGSQKIKNICDLLKEESIKPAKQESEKIIADAQERAKQIIQEAETQAQTLHDEARNQIEQERNVFQSALEQAAKQSLDALRQEVEHKVLNQGMQSILEQQTSQPEIIAKLIQAIVEAIQKEGISADFSVVIPQKVSAKEVNALIGQDVLSKLKEKSVILGPFAGGAQVKMHDKRITIDITDASLKDLMLNYVRKDFRKLFFVS
jgi:V/A-type H+/Na+-transporting ATPase subunit E